MSAWLARAEAWLLEPAEADHAVASPVPSRPISPPPARLRVSVIGLAHGAGATTVARALGVELARRDSGGVAVVMSERTPAAALPIATPAALRLARSVRALGCEGARATGRLCLAAGPSHAAALAAPVVFDAGRAASGTGGADRTVLVAGAAAEPALAQVVSASFARGGRAPDLVANRVEDAAPWEAIGALVVGESRLAAVLALAGRDPRGRLGAVVRDLADRWEPDAW